MEFASLIMVATLGSFHFDRDKGYNEINPGIGVEAPLSDSIYGMAGGYLNSHEVGTAYLGGGVKVWRLGGIADVAIEAAYLYGYDNFNAGGGVAITHNESGFKALITPVFIGIQYKF